MNRPEISRGEGLSTTEQSQCKFYVVINLSVSLHISSKFPSALNFSNLRMSFFSLKSIDLVAFVTYAMDQCSFALER